ncbi:MAG: Stp1/IreP family PP2C-type Ser/Thr phosphatase [Clostridia bacterium]|nr:Stp1/IreP family PP2C-type Ser/Thr phosphatase [Clostridia bacterium]MBQ3077489.1 Stp1/IreP family PP2C-type Ser/Thr phosphatase [Clostridia bacterium]
MIIEGRSHIGLVRQANQDAFDSFALPGGACFAIVCDGMGGPGGGEVASSVTVEQVSRRIREGYSEGIGEDDLLRLVRTALEEASALVYERSRQDEALFGMGTTAVLALVTGQRAYLANVGDSRAYLFSRSSTGEQRLRQISRDHSVVQELIDGGSITTEEARTHPKRNIITRALGTQTGVSADFFKVAIYPGERLLLCSDGLTNMVTEAGIYSILSREPDNAAAADRLIEAALEAGATDNVTALLITHQEATKWET